MAILSKTRPKHYICQLFIWRTITLCKTLFNRFSQSFNLMAKVAFKKDHVETCCEFRAILAAKGTKAQTTQQKVS